MNDRSLGSVSRGMVWQYPDSMLGETAVQISLLQAVSNVKQVTESILPYSSDPSRKFAFDLIQADKVSSDLAILLPRRPSSYHGWLGTNFPVPILAVVLPVLSPRKWYHFENNVLRQDVGNHIAMLIKSQKAYLYSFFNLIK